MKPYRTNLRDVPRVEGLSREDGWINMQVQFLIDQKSAGSEKLLIGWTVLPPGARHDKHRHPNADEFFIVIQGRMRDLHGHGARALGKGRCNSQSARALARIR